MGSHGEPAPKERCGNDNRRSKEDDTFLSQSHHHWMLHLVLRTMSTVPRKSVALPPLVFCDGGGDDEFGGDVDHFGSSEWVLEVACGGV